MPRVFRRPWSEESFLDARRGSAFGGGKICESCSATIPADKENCRALFDEMIAREFSDYRYGRRHRLTVDAYSLQHPGSFMRSGKSFAAHLTGMCAEFEFNDPAKVNKSVQLWLSGSKEIPKPHCLPSHHGSLTIAFLYGAEGAVEYLERVREWAACVWEAWSQHHNLARLWIQEALRHSSDFRRPRA